MITGQQLVKYPGLTLKAWAYFSGTTGAVIKSGGITSVTRTGVGTYAIVFSNAMNAANYLIDSMAMGIGVMQSSISNYSMSVTVGGITFTSTVAGSPADMAGQFVAFYE